MVLNLLFSIIMVATTSQNANDLTTQSPSIWAQRANAKI
jgi:hypothetical protein